MVGANRIQSLPVSIFSTMSRLAVEYNAINLGQGFPDFDGPTWIFDEALKVMKSGKNQYAPMNGILSLRQEVSRLAKKYYDLEWNFNSEITITTGATEGLYSSINALINPGDEVILFEPFYDSYQSDIILAGGVPKYVTLKKPDFSFDFDALEKAITSSTKMIIVNNPHNPTGKVYTKQELEMISNLAIKNDLLVISDEVYEFLLFDDAKHIPIASLKGMKERTITVSSCGKTFGLTGWKIGFVYAIPELTSAIQKVHQWTTFAVNTPGQHAMAYAFTKLESYLPDFRAIYQGKRDLIIQLLKETAFSYHIPMGSYFIMVDIPNKPSTNDIDLAKELVIKFGVATIPPSVFYNNSDEGKSMLRLCFAKSEKTLIDGVEKLKKYGNG